MVASIPVTLAPNWFEEMVNVGIDPEQPGLFAWRIEGLGTYIGQYTRPSVPRLAYGANVSKLLNGEPYRKGKPDEFRVVHRRLHQAIKEEKQITLIFLENISDKPSRNRRKRELIAELQRKADRDGLPVLNSQAG